MKERPILFSAPMVRALIDGTKTQTRRVVKYDIRGPSEPMDTWDWYDAKGEWVGAHGRGYPFAKTNAALLSPYGQPCDRLWVRETWDAGGNDIGYRADMASRYVPPTDPHYGESMRMFDRQRGRWNSSIYMPRWASRITLEVTGVRVERLQDISEADALAEGVTAGKYTGLDRAYARAYSDLWEQINGPGSWDANPWVWVVEFKGIGA